MRRDANGVSMADARYAIYFAPGAGSELERVCSSVLGRCARTGRELEQPVLPGVEPKRLAELTASARHYGLHATLKPPFFLAEGTTEADLLKAVAGLAACRPAFELPPLRLESLGSFLALTPSAPCPELDALARTCVTELDRFRRPASDAELARRRTKRLTTDQDRLLERWGYPYVLEQFRFHLTLTDKIPAPHERERLRAALAPLLCPVLHTPVPVRDICVFLQRCSKEPFTMLQRFELALIPEPNVS